MREPPRHGEVYGPGEEPPATRPIYNQLEAMNQSIQESRADLGNLHHKVDLLHGGLKVASFACYAIVILMLVLLWKTK